MPRPFLTAHWRYLLMLNYEIEPGLLRPFLPRGTELDQWQGRTYASMVGFLFLDARLLGIPIPFHRHFEEVNLRFYVRRRGPEGWRRGVVFIKELVPRWAIAAVARWVYNERYQALPMGHTLPGENGRQRVEYRWRFGGEWHRLSAAISGEPQPIKAGSEAEFITEHYWGYAAQRDGGTVEYQVEHPRWRVWPAVDSSFVADVGALYGAQFAAPLAATPTSAFVADGSAVAVHRGRRID